MPKPLSEAALKNWQAAYARWAERDAKDWAANPNNPNRSIATAMYRGQPNRAYVSPLDGRAVRK